jgi:hypothetical protein
MSNNYNRFEILLLKDLDICRKNLCSLRRHHGECFMSWCWMRTWWCHRDENLCLPLHAFGWIYRRKKVCRGLGSIMMRSLFGYHEFPLLRPLTSYHYLTIHSLPSQILHVSLIQGQYCISPPTLHSLSPLPHYSDYQAPPISSLSVNCLNTSGLDST